MPLLASATVRECLEWLTRIRDRIRQDISEDPLLLYILALPLVLGAIGIWYRTPNFANPDEYSRLIDPVKAAGRTAADPSLASFRAGVLDGRALGATFYLYALVLVPVFLFVVVSGQLSAFAELGSVTSRWELWHRTPAWFWTANLLLGRFVSLVLGVCCVYLTYRLGVELRNRHVGRLAATTLGLSTALVDSLHTMNEDVPMLVLMLLTLLLVVRFVETGRSRDFLLGCLTAGLAVAFKLTAGTAVVTIGVAYLLRAWRAPDLRAALVRPRLVGAGLLVGFVAIYVGIPSVLFGGPERLVTRVLHTGGQKTSQFGGDVAFGPFWILRGYLAGLGLAMVVGIATVGAWRSLAAVRGDRSVDPRYVVVFVPLVVALAVYARWNWVRVHHLLPTVPPLLIGFATAIDGPARRSRPVRVAVAVLLLLTAAFAAGGAAGFLNDPRDGASDWLRENVDEGETVEVYGNSIAEYGAVHGTRFSRYEFPEENATYNGTLVLNETDYTEWMLDMPERRPAYIQLTAGIFKYVDPDHPDYHRYPERRAFVRALLDGEYNYSVAVEFGHPPGDPSVSDRLLRAGVVPRLEHREEYVVILRRANA